jgi:hypothetical protein
VERHIRILGIIYIALGALGILAALLLFVGVTGEGLLSENKETILISTATATAVGVFLGLISIFAVIAATALMGARVGDRLRLSVPAQFSAGHRNRDIHSLGAHETGSAGGALARLIVHL